MAEDFTIGGESADFVPDAGSATVVDNAPAADTTEQSIADEIEGTGPGGEVTLDDDIEAAFKKGTKNAAVEAGDELGEDDEEVVDPNAQAKPDPAAEEVDPNAAKPDPKAVADKLPEGVKRRTLDGKPVWAVDEAKGKEVFAKAELVTKAEDLIGEPLTEEALKWHARNSGIVESIRGDILSNDPKDHANFVNGIASMINKAQENGEIGHDALTGLTLATIDSALGDESPTAPAVLTHLLSSKRVQAAFADHLYTAALNLTEQTRQNPELTLAQNQEALWMMGQWIDHMSQRPLRGTEQMKYLLSDGAKGLPNFERRDQPGQPGQQTQQPTQQKTQQAAPVADRAAEVFQNWDKNVNLAIHKQANEDLVAAEINLHFTDEQKKMYPINVKHVTDQLTSALRQRLQSDEKLKESRAIIIKRAKIAAKDDVRTDLQNQMVQRHVDRGKQILREIKGPILSEDAQLRKAKSDQNAARARTSQQVGRAAAPSGGPSAARQQKAPAKTGFFRSNEDMEREIEESFTR